MSNCKIEASAKRLLQYCPDDLEESMPGEIIHFSTLIKPDHFNSECKEIQLLRFINKNKFMHTFLNVSVVFRLYLCLMIFNCSGERSFLIQNGGKNLLHSSMGQKRLNSLALLCIENKLLEKIDTDYIIKSRNGRFRKLRTSVSNCGFANLIFYCKYFRICGEKIKIYSKSAKQ